MADNLDTILENLKARQSRTTERVQSPFIYLDPEAVRHLFQELTGLSEPPRVRIKADEDGKPGRTRFTLGPGPGFEPPAQVLFQAMVPILREKITLVRQADDLKALTHGYARIQGLLQATHFPDGNLNLELVFAGVHGMLFYTPGFFSSMARPLLTDDRFHTLSCRVEAHVYVHGPVQKTIFYHQTYGDNVEHTWLPLAPVALMENSSQDGQDG